MILPTYPGKIPQNPTKKEVPPEMVGETSFGYLPGVCRSDLRDLSLLCWQKKHGPKTQKLPHWSEKNAAPPFPARSRMSRWCCSSSFHRCQVWRWFLQNTSWNQSFFASLPVTRSCRWISKTRWESGMVEEVYREFPYQCLSKKKWTPTLSALCFFATGTSRYKTNVESPGFLFNPVKLIDSHLVGGFNPFEKYGSKWESSPNRYQK